MKTALISIIIPVFNREEIVKTTLDSILKQSYSNWECLIIDDGSNDNTEHTIANYSLKDKRISFYKRPEKLTIGANSCRNYGFTLAKGKYVNWFDSDDIMEPNFLEDKIKSFTPNIDAVIHKNKYANYDLTTFRESKFIYNNGKSLFCNYAMETIELQTCCFLWRKDFLCDKTLFDDTMMRYQDNEFHIRMLALKPKVVILEKVLATIRGGNNTQISAKKNETKEKLFNIFYYRYQCLFLDKKYNLNMDQHFKVTISKKAIWAFYAALKFEQKIFKRINDVKERFKELNFVLKTNGLSYKDVVKAKMYISKIIFFR